MRKEKHCGSENAANTKSCCNPQKRGFNILSNLCSFSLKFHFKYNGKKLTFAEMPEMLSDEEWVAIEEIVESCPNYGLSSYGAIQKAFYIAAGIVLLTIIAFRIVARCSS